MVNFETMLFELIMRQRKEAFWEAEKEREIREMDDYLSAELTARIDKEVLCRGSIYEGMPKAVQQELRERFGELERVRCAKCGSWAIGQRREGDAIFTLHNADKTLKDSREHGCNTCNSLIRTNPMNRERAERCSCGWNSRPL